MRSHKNNFELFVLNQWRTEKVMSQYLLSIKEVTDNN